MGSLGAAEAMDNCDSEVEIGYSDSLVLLNDCRYGRGPHLDGRGRVRQQQDSGAADHPDRHDGPRVHEALPGDATVSCDAVPMPETLTATDNCDPAVFVQFTETQSDDDLCPTDYTLTRVWTVTDCAGNEISHSQTLAVVDTEAPIFTTGPLDATVECDAVPAPASVTSLQADDNCDKP